MCSVLCACVCSTCRELISGQNGVGFMIDSVNFVYLFVFRFLSVPMTEWAQSVSV